MDIIQLDSIQLPTLTHLLVTLILLYAAQWIDQLVLNLKRERLVHNQRELYFKKLHLEAIKMEDERSREDLQVAKEIESLREVEDELKSRMSLQDLEAYESEVDNCRSASESSQGEEEDRHLEDEEQVQELANELEQVQLKASRLRSIENEVSRLESNIVVKEECDVDKDILRDNSQLLKKIQELEQENESLKLQLSNTEISSQSIMQTSNLDPQLLDYLEKHYDILTLDFLEKAHERLIELKAVEPDKDFDAYIEELKQTQNDYNKRLAELKVSKKKVEIELNLMKEQYQKELQSFNESRIEHLLKNSGGSSLVKSLQDRNKLDREIIEELERKLKSCKSELASWEKKYNDTDKQATVYFHAFETTKNELETLKKAQNQDRQFIYNQPMNVSSPSSLIGTTQVPPPPPIDIPSYEELIKAASNSNQLPPLFNTDANLSIPPPPPLDMPINEILRQCNP